MLSVEAKNFDLTGFDPNSIKFYYMNDNGIWEEYPVYEIFVDVQWGTIRIIGAQIPHFSRYGIGIDWFL